MSNHPVFCIVPLIVLLVQEFIVSVWPFIKARLLKSGNWRRSMISQFPTQKPVCPACHTAEEETPATKPPPVLEYHGGRPRYVDTSNHYCPNLDCSYYGWVGYGNIVSNGHPNSGRWRQLQCTVCNTYFMETRGTIFYGCNTPPDTIWQALKALAEGLDIQATARVFEVEPDTVQDWLNQAAEHMEAVCRYMLHDLHLKQVQVDELWALLGLRQEKSKRNSRWVWSAIDPVSKLFLSFVVGDRSLDTAQLLIHSVVQILTPGCVPLFTSDQWSPYAIALLTHFGHWAEMPRRHKRGRPPEPRWLPLPALQYAQVVKRRVSGRVVEVSRKVVYGSLKAVKRVMSQTGVGRIINMAFIERLNLTIRHHVAALGRKVMSLAKTQTGLEAQLNLCQVYHNFCLPHSSLRLPLPRPQPTRGSGSPRKWQQRTPAMAAGVTDHIWRMGAVLLFRPPPWPQTIEMAA